MHHSSLNCEYCVQFQRKQDSSYTKSENAIEKQGKLFVIAFFFIEIKLTNTELMEKGQHL